MRRVPAVCTRAVIFASLRLAAAATVVEIAVAVAGAAVAAQTEDQDQEQNVVASATTEHVVTSLAT